MNEVDTVEIDKVYILGAGFSVNAGIPTQSEFLDALSQHEKKGKDSDFKNYLCEGIQKYISKIYGEQPDLEDVFTCLDLSANTGHHLGRLFSPSRLRSLRRILIARIIQVIAARYQERELMHAFSSQLELKSAGFVVLNWDTVLERELIRVNRDVAFDYGCGEITHDSAINRVSKTGVKGTSVNVAKVHGSTNWLYCDNCRNIYILSPSNEVDLPNQIIKSNDLTFIKKTLLNGKPFEYRQKVKHRCLKCDTVLGTRIATFSYRKVLDAPMLIKSWFWAEKLLADAREWIFIGYSLPAADYEFKYMLKRLEMADPNGKTITVVTKNGSDPYKKFFKRIITDNIVDKGLHSYVKRM